MPPIDAAGATGVGPSTGIGTVTQYLIEGGVTVGISTAADGSAHIQAPTSGVPSMPGTGASSVVHYTTSPPPLTEDLHCTLLTVDAGVTLLTAGHKIFSQTDVVNNGLIHNDATDNAYVQGGETPTPTALWQIPPMVTSIGAAAAGSPVPTILGVGGGGVVVVIAGGNITGNGTFSAGGTGVVAYSGSREGGTIVAVAETIAASLTFTASPGLTPGTPGVVILHQTTIGAQ